MLTPRSAFRLGRLALGLVAGLGLAAATNTPAFRPIQDSLLPEGRYVFERNCVICHGKWGDGRGEMARDLVPRPRKFTSGVFKFRSTPSGALPTDADLTRTIRGGLFGTAMPTFQHLSDREVSAVIEYLKTFSRKWTEPANHAPSLALPPLPGWFNDAPERTRRAAEGKAVFLANCAACHGETGRGDGPAAAELEDDWGQPAPPMDLTLASLKSGPRPEDIYRVLVTGLNGTPMPSFLETTTETQRWDLVAYLTSLRPQP